MTHEDEQIDQSHWLGRDDTLLTPERAAMLGLTEQNKKIIDGGLTGVEVKVKNLMTFLAEKRIIDDQEFFDGSTYQIWRSQATLLFRNEVIPYDALEDKPRGSNFGEFGFILLCKRLKRHDLEAINETIDTDSTAIAMRMAHLVKEDPFRHEQAHRSLKNTYQGAFARLVVVMPGVRDITAKMKEMHERGESLVDFTRQFR